MTTLHHVKKARKAQRRHGIKRGDSYFWWAFRIGSRSVKHVSKARPRRSQYQTQSPFLRQMLDGEDEVKKAADEFMASGDKDAFLEAIKAVGENVRILAEECRSSRENLPPSLREGAPGQRLEDRAEACERIADELEAAAAEVDGMDGEPADGVDEEGNEDGGVSMRNEWLERVAEAIDGVDWSVE